jgi:2-(1,2-epoxy-1,2-dihydrophenyl)acetyl-CoA isomerase
MTDDSPLLVLREGSTVHLVMNRPNLGNAIDVPMARALMEAAIVCDEDASVRCVVLTGAGRMFCAGGDVRLFTSAGDVVPALLKELTSYLHSAISRLARMEKPLITAINGPAAGAGFSLAMLGDIVLASRDAHFTLAYGRLGLSPDGGATWLLPRLIGLRRTQELILTNPRISAAQAVGMGLVTRVCAPDEDGAESQAKATTDTGPEERLAAQVRVLSDDLAAGAIGAWGRTRALLLASYGAGLEGTWRPKPGRSRSAADLRKSAKDSERWPPVRCRCSTSQPRARVTGILRP